MSCEKYNSDGKCACALDIKGYVIGMNVLCGEPVGKVRRGNNECIYAGGIEWGTTKQSRFK